MDNTYVYLSNSDSVQYYPQNKPTAFTVLLPQSLQLKGKWSANLLDICIKRKHNTSVKDVYVACSIVRPSYVKEQSIAILRQITVRNSTRQVFTSPQYVTIDNNSDISEINITLLDTDTLQPTKLDAVKVNCTIHIKRDNPPFLI